MLLESWTIIVDIVVIVVVVLAVLVVCSYMLGRVKSLVGEQKK